MKKQIIIALVFLISAFSIAQKKELKAVEKAIKTGSYAVAKSTLKEVEASLPSMDDELKNKYYYLKAKSLFGIGRGTLANMDVVLENLSKINSGYVSEIAELKKDINIALANNGQDAYKKNDFSKASKIFEKAYSLKKSDTIFLYYAASTAVNVKEYDRALVMYEELKDLGYTGIRTEYFASNPATAEVEVFDKDTRDLYVKLGTHVEPGERKISSKKPEIVKNIALIYVNKGENEKALLAMKEARSESPNDIDLILSEANVHYKLGNTEEFKNLLQKATELDPTNPELQYNLGVISAESSHLKEAKAYYKKAIELDSNYVDAYINLSALVLASQKPILEEMNGLGTSRADNNRYEQLKKERENIFGEALPFLVKAFQIDDKNIAVAQTLRNIYSKTGQMEKFKEMKAKIDALDASSGN